MNFQAAEVRWCFECLLLPVLSLRNAWFSVNCDSKNRRTRIAAFHNFSSLRTLGARTSRPQAVAGGHQSVRNARAFQRYFLPKERPRALNCCSRGQRSMPSRPSISVFFPAYNDAGTIPSMVLTALLTLRRIADDYEVIVVNDGSQDHTPQLLEELASCYPEVRVIHHLKNAGYGGALRTGIAQSRKELIFYTDGDAQYDVRELEKLLPLMTEGVDMVNGFKISRSDPFYRSLLGTPTDC